MKNFRLICSANRATYNFEFKRCYFVLRHGELGVPFEQEVRKCESAKVVLLYPKSEKEVGYLWDFFEQEAHELTLWDYLDVTLRTGFEKSNQTDFLRHNLFSSVDGKMTVSKSGQTWFTQDQTVVTRIDRGIFSPCVCISKAQKLLQQCMANSFKKISVCSVDVTI